MVSDRMVFCGRGWQTVAVLCGLALVALSGCRQGMYNARSLPPELVAAPVPEVESLELSRLGGGGLRNEVIYHGDVLEVKAVTGAEEGNPPTWRLRVAQDGTLDIPLVGPVPLAGLDLVAAEHAISEASVQRGVFRSPKISVSIRARRVNRVTVVGAVNKPTTYELPVASSNLMAALFAAGGLTDEADSIVEIRQPAGQGGSGSGSEGLNVAGQGHGEYVSLRHEASDGQQEVVQVDLLAATATNAGNYYLDDGAVLTVKKQQKRVVHVMGLVRRPQQFELPRNQDIRLLDALANAGGTSMTDVVADKVYVIRKVADSDETVIIKASIRKAKKDGQENILLAAGDIVSVEETPTTFALGSLQKILMMAFWAGRLTPMF